MLKLRSLAGTLLLASSMIAFPASAGEMPTVVELFTSQGCSSCPPADIFIGELAKRDDVLALSFNVDYWDYLGWKDTLASPANSQRQRDYAAARRQRRVYTPQMIVGGVADAVGSDRQAVWAAIEQLRGNDIQPVPIDFSKRDGKLLIRIGGGSHAGDATIWLVRFDAAKSVEILRGENTGRSITYHNVVKDFWTLGLWQGEPMEIALRLDELDRGETDGCAVIVQKGGHGRIIGAARMALHRAWP